MKSMWRVIERPVAGRIFYQAYRLNDVCADNVEKNRETWGGYYVTRKEAENVADWLNKEGV